MTIVWIISYEYLRFYFHVWMSPIEMNVVEG